MKNVEINNNENIESMDEFIQAFASESDNDSGNSFTAKVVEDSLNLLFPDEGKIRALMMVSNVTNWQLTHIIKALHSAYVLGLNENHFKRESVYEYRLKIIEDILRCRVSVNSRGRKDIVESLKAIMLNELHGESSRLKRLVGKA